MPYTCKNNYLFYDSKSIKWALYQAEVDVDSWQRWYYSREEKSSPQESIAVAGIIQLPRWHPSTLCSLKVSAYKVDTPT